MSFAVMAIFLAFLGAAPLGFIGSPLTGAWVNFGLSLAVFCLTLIASAAPGLGLVQADRLGLLFGMLSGFIAATTAAVNCNYVSRNAVQMSTKNWRIYHASFQATLGAVLLGLYADNIGLFWFAVEIATLSGAGVIGLTRGPAAVAACRKYLVFGTMGLAFALLGTLLVYLAAQPALGTSWPALSFASLSSAAGRMNGTLLMLAFLFLLLGYGTRAALVPMEAWLPDAAVETPSPLLAALQLLPINLALVGILRFRHLLQTNAATHGGALPPGPLLCGIGLLSLWLAAISMTREGNVRRFLSLSTIAHSGIVIFAFGVGGAAAIFAGLLHMVLNGLVKSALFQSLAGAATGRFSFHNLRGILAGRKYYALVFGAALFALTGLPPSGFFTSEFLIVSQAVQRLPWLVPPLILGLVLYAAAVLRRVAPLLSIPATKMKPVVDKALLFPALHLVLALLLAFAMPLSLVHMLSASAVSLR